MGPETIRNDSHNNKNTQRGRILALLMVACCGEVGLPEILQLGIARYGARIGELRKRGYDIQNRTETVDGEKRSWYRLVPSPTLPAQSQERVAAHDSFSKPAPTNSQPALFDLGAPDRNYRE
jgi:Helix-turn-helix domain